MIQLKPYISTSCSCSCGGDLYFSEYLWQGLHVCEILVCNRCNKKRINSLPVNQSILEPYTFYPDSGVVNDAQGNIVPDNWYSKKLRSIVSPVQDDIEIEIDIIRKYDEVLILNTLDYIYGHSFLFLLNLQQIVKSGTSLGIVVIVQPMLKWLIPREDVAEIWTVNLEFKSFNNYYPDLSTKINSELDRFKKVELSKGHVIPTNENININKFTGIKPYDFLNEPAHPRITFIWREDPDRLWIRNIYLSKGFKKIGFGLLLIPFQYLRIIFIFKLLKNKLGMKYNYSVAGLGKFGRFPSFIKDGRAKYFTEETEKMLCKVYAESALVIGVHGSGMLLPSAHAGMAISLMPSKRWANYAEDILFIENDVRLASFQRRIVPLNMCIFDLIDIISDMISGRDYFLKKFIHSDEL